MTVRGSTTARQRCPACAGWSPPGASTCTRCGGALRGGVANPPSRHIPSTKVLLLVLVATVAGGGAWLSVRVASSGATSAGASPGATSRPFLVERQSFEPLPEPTAPPGPRQTAPARRVFSPIRLTPQKVACSCRV